MVDSSDPASISDAIPGWEPGREPDLIYHYTDARGMIGIISSGTLWATDLRYMNDPGEPTYSLKIIERFLADHKPESKEAEETFGRVRKLFGKTKESEVDLPGYIACLSEKPELLSQWRAYGRGHGFCIGFDYHSLLDLFSSYGQRYRIGKVIYDCPSQLDRLSHAAMEAEAESSTFGSFAALVTAAVFFKDPAFQEEAEVRIYSFLPGDPPTGIKFRDSELGITPFVSIPLYGPDKTVSVIRKIVIGPQPLANEAKLTLSQFLKAKGLEGVEIVRSLVPLRL